VETAPLASARELLRAGETMVSEDDLWLWMSKLAAAVTPLEVAVAVADVGADAAGAAFANLALLDPEQRWVRVVHGSSLDPDIAARWVEFPLSAQTPLCEAIQTGRPVLLGSPEAIGERYPNLLADTLAASLTATASMPLRAANDDSLGAAGFAWTRPQAFEPEQMNRLDLVSRLAAQALDRALLYERSRGRESAEKGDLADHHLTTDHHLMKREREVLQLIAVGYTNPEIANLLGVSLRTVESTRSQLRQNLGLRTRAQLVRFAFEQGLANP
jgi:DNA-binding CsgD family transcriptional regulator